MQYPERVLGAWTDPRRRSETEEVYGSRDLASTVNPNAPSTLTAPLFPPSKSAEARRRPVANSYAVPRIAFGGYRRPSQTSSYVVVGANPCCEKKPFEPRRSYSRMARTTWAWVTRFQSSEGAISPPSLVASGHHDSVDIPDGAGHTAGCRLVQDRD